MGEDNGLLLIWILGGRSHLINLHQAGKSWSQINLQTLLKLSNINVACLTCQITNGKLHVWLLKQFNGNQHEAGQVVPVKIWLHCRNYSYTNKPACLQETPFDLCCSQILPRHFRQMNELLFILFYIPPAVEEVRRLCIATCAHSTWWTSISHVVKSQNYCT